MEVTNRSGTCGHRSDLCDFLFEAVSQRCSPAVTSTSLSISIELTLQQTLHAWSRYITHTNIHAGQLYKEVWETI